MKVNDYVRTTNGYIGKIFNINEYREPTLKYGILTNYIDMVDTHFIGEEDIIKTSPNIIDLIEEGDLVKIEFYSPRYHKRLIRLFEVEYKDNDWIRFCNSHCDLSYFHHQWGGTDSKLKPIIKSIVTKEQFKSMEYKVGKE